jgi:luciferase family oxidoreductase group 1
MKLSVLDQSPIPAGVSSAQALQNTIDLARYTEALGYDRYWIAEHHASASLASPAPEIMMCRVAAETSTIRIGSGAVLLPHYSSLKVVETFRVLHALYPGRIDLGIGRAPGGSRLEAYALQRDRTQEAEREDFGHQMVELLTFFRREYPETHVFSRIHVSPDMPGFPQVWLLGSSGWSADAAAFLGLPYGAAHFINPQSTRESIAHYKANFKPSPEWPEPRVLIATGAIVADTPEEAEFLHSSQRLRRLLRDLGESGPIPTPEDATKRLAELDVESAPEHSEWPRMLVGDAAGVKSQLDDMAEQLGVDEFMLVTVVHSHEARKHSYDLLARAYNLTSLPAATPATPSSAP